MGFGGRILGGFGGFSEGCHGRIAGCSFAILSSAQMRSMPGADRLEDAYVPGLNRQVSQDCNDPHLVLRQTADLLALQIIP